MSHDDIYECARIQATVRIKFKEFENKGLDGYLNALEPLSKKKTICVYDDSKSLFFELEEEVIEGSFVNIGIYSEHFKNRVFVPVDHKRSKKKNMRFLKYINTLSEEDKYLFQNSRLIICVNTDTKKYTITNR